MTINCAPDPCTDFVQPEGVRWDKINRGETLKVAYENNLGPDNENIKARLEDAAAIWNTGLPCDFIECVDDPAEADFVLFEVQSGASPPEYRTSPWFHTNGFSQGNDYDLGCIGSCVAESAQYFQEFSNISNPTVITEFIAMELGEALGITALVDGSPNIMGFIPTFGSQTEANVLGPYDIAELQKRYTCKPCADSMALACEEPECMRWGFLNTGGTLYVGYDDTAAPANFLLLPRIEEAIVDAMQWWNDTVKCNHNILEFTDDPNLINFYIMWDTLDEDVAGNSTTLVGCEPVNGTNILEDFNSTGMGTINLNNLPATIDLFNNVYSYKDLVDLIAHELGHSLGIDHPNPIGTAGTMGYNQSRLYQHSWYDIQEIRRRYPCCQTNFTVRLPYLGPPSIVPKPCPGCKVKRLNVGI